MLSQPRPDPYLVTVEQLGRTANCDVCFREAFLRNRRREAAHPRLDDTPSQRDLSFVFAGRAAYEVHEALPDGRFESRTWELASDALEIPRLTEPVLIAGRIGPLLRVADGVFAIVCPTTDPPSDSTFEYLDRQLHACAAICRSAKAKQLGIDRVHSLWIVWSELQGTAIEPMLAQYVPRGDFQFENSLARLFELAQSSRPVMPSRRCPQSH